MGVHVKRRSPAEEAWILITDLFAEVRPRMIAVAGEFGLTPPQLWALKALEPDKPVPMRELASLLHCDNSNVTGLVDRLAAQGLVERRESDRDRRVRMLALTDRGVEVRERFHAVMRQVPPALAQLDPADQRALRDVLRRALG